MNVRRAAIHGAAALLGAALLASGARAAPPPRPDSLSEVSPPDAAATPTPVSTSAPVLVGPPEPDTVGPPAPRFDLVGPPAPEEEVGPPSPERPVARIEEKLVVKGKKAKKAKREELVGPPVDKVWLAEVCPLDDSAGGSWLDRSQQRLGWSVCRATLWFDGLFGDERAIAERDATYGYVQPKLSWNEFDGVDPDVRFRAKINLPVADRRFNALLGRTNAEEGPRDSDNFGAELLPDSFREADDEWLVGLGYAPVRDSRRRLDFDAGVELSTPVEVFAQGRYRRHWFMGDRDLVRMRQSVFWRSEEGFGTRVDVDFERVLNGPYVVRWRNSATYAQHLHGVRWFDEVTLFQRLGERQALAYVASANGETEADVTVDRYELELVYRRNILREWLFVEMRPGIAWRRPEADLRREITPTLGVGLEIQFGDRDFD